MGPWVFDNDWDGCFLSKSVTGWDNNPYHLEDYDDETYLTLNRL